MANSSLIPALQGATASAPNNINNPNFDPEYEETVIQLRRKTKHFNEYAHCPQLRLITLEKVQGALTTLEQTEIKRSLNEDVEIDKALLIILDPENQFGERERQRAEALYRKWEAANWGATEGTADDEDHDDEQQTLMTTAAPTSTASQGVSCRPPPNHPIWGIKGIMHGLEPVNGKTFKLNTRYTKRSARPGDNSLKPGDWFPYQMAALFNGAHGSAQSGVVGDDKYGAHSIVLSGKYKDVDDDQGDIIYYSGPGSHDNTNPIRPPRSPGNTYLRRSLQTRRALRVLRHASKSPHAPCVGLRYDGLYRVIGMEAQPRHNDKGGMYNRYVLRRCPGQDSLADIQTRSPTKRQRWDYYKVWDLW